MPIVLKQHRLSAKFPAMLDEDFSALVSDISANGQKEYITLHEGMVLDGWNRYLACKKIGIEPKVGRLNGTDPITYVLSKNLHRRHLSASQRAMIVVSFNAEGANFSPPLTNAELIEESGTSHQTVKDAKTVEAKGSPALKEAVKDGKVSVSQAAKSVKPAKPESPPSKAEKVAEPDDDAPDLVKELERADKEIRNLQALVESLKTTDLAKEVAAWHLKFDQLEGRLHQEMTTRAVAEKTAERAISLLAKIRGALKVQRNSEILPALAK